MAGEQVIDRFMEWRAAMPPLFETVIEGRKVALTASREPLVDTEVLPAGGFPGGTTQALTYFTSGEGEAMQFTYFGARLTKTPSDTTMLQGGSLGTPEIVDAYQVAICPEFGTAFNDLVEIYRRAHIVFKFGSTQVVFRVPLKLIPAAVGLDGATNEVAVGSAHNGWAVLTNAWPITVKGSPRRIFSTEKPSLQIVWDSNPVVSKDLLLQVAMFGIRYRP